MKKAITIKSREMIGMRLGADTSICCGVVRVGPRELLRNTPQIIPRTSVTTDSSGIIVV